MSVFEGNTGDPKTLIPQVEKMRNAFGIEQFVMNEDELIAEVTAKSKGNHELIEKRLKKSRRHIESIARQLAKLSQRQLEDEIEYV